MIATIAMIMDIIRTGAPIARTRRMAIVPIPIGPFLSTEITGMTIFMAALPTGVTTIADGITTTTDLTTGHAPVFIWV